jgi:myosin I
VKFVPPQLFQNIHASFKILGIISFLDEECLRPGDTSDMGFLNKMNINLAKHNHFISHVKGDKKTQKELARNVI